MTKLLKRVEVFWVVTPYNGAVGCKTQQTSNSIVIALKTSNLASEQNHYLVIANKCIENVAKFKYFGTAVTN
jgi:hypothetical protein